MNSLLTVTHSQALAERDTLMPGYSHHRRAFVTSWGHQLGAYLQAWTRDLERCGEIVARVNCSPLGAAAGFGTSWPINRQRASELLGFQGLVENSLDAVSSRLEVEIEIAGWLSLWMSHCATVAQDLILYSMEEFRWVELTPEVTTGSSIMPQKRNPDFAEVIKGKAALTQGGLMSLLCLAKGQPSGYHRDSQYSKPIGQDIWRETSGVAGALQAVFSTLRLDREKMQAALQGGFLEAAEWADFIAQQSGLPFRDVYHVIGRAVDACRAQGTLDFHTVNQELINGNYSFQLTPEMGKSLMTHRGLINQRCSKGSPNPLQVENHLKHLTEQWERIQDTISMTIEVVNEGNAKRQAALEQLIQS